MSRSASFSLAGFLVAALAAVAVLAVIEGRRRETAAGPIVLKLGHSLDITHPVHLAMVDMAERLERKSEGRVRLEIYPSGQLGNETECIAQLQTGVLAMTKTSAAPLEGFVPPMAIFGLPYVFRDEDHYWNVLNGPVGAHLLRAGERTGLRGLCYYDAGSRSFYTIDRPVLTPADLHRGGNKLKIRVQNSRTAMDMIATLGGAPTPIPWGELYTALQQGMVDGAENNPPSFLSSKHYEVCKHFSLDEHTCVPDVLLIAVRVWRRLPPEVRSWVQEAADESSVFQRRLWQEKTEEALREVQETGGVTVYHPDKQPFADTVSGMYAPYEGTEIGDVLRRIRETE